MAIAIPAYQDYTVRAKVSEGLNVAGAAKLAVSETYQALGDWPGGTPGNASAGLPPPTSITGNNVASVTVATSTISIRSTADTNIAGDTLLLPATHEGGSISWLCGEIGRASFRERVGRNV